jgi:membrane-bound serine protease (ClpP class)
VLTNRKTPLNIEGQTISKIKWLILFQILAFSALGADVVSIKIHGTINPATAHFLSQAIVKAEALNANFVLVELDTPGGLVSSVREMAQSIDQSKVPVVVYTFPAGSAATSAGALLMISSHLAAMAPGSNIGAAHPVGSQGEEIKGPMGEKAVNDISAFARAMAELRGRNSKVAMDVVSKSSSYTAEEALKLKLIEVIAPNLEDLWQALDNRQVKVGQEMVTLKTQPPPQIHKIEMSWGEQVLNALSHPNIAAILMSLAMLLIYTELSAPGVGFGGVLGGLLLIVSFVALQAIPVMTGGLVLLGAGAALFVAEIFVVSGGALALGGTISFILGLLWLVDPAATDLHVSTWVIASIGSVLVLGSLIIGFGVSRIKSQSEKALRKIGGGDNAGLKGYPGIVRTVAAGGKSGQVQIRGELWKFVSDETLGENDSVVVKSNNSLILDVVRAKE